MDTKPTLEELSEALKKTRGNLTNTARLLGISRTTLWRYGKEIPEMGDLIKESRKEKLDQFVTTAELLALGIPDIDPDTKKVVGLI